MLNILRLINNEKLMIEKELSKEDERLNYYIEFFKNNPCSSLKEAIAADACDLAIAITTHILPDMPLEKIKRVVYGNRLMYEGLDWDSLGNFAGLLDTLTSDKEVYDKAKNILLGNTKLSKFSNRKYEIEMVKILKTLNESIGNSPKDFIDFLDFYIEDTNIFGDVFAPVVFLRRVKDAQESSRMALDAAAEEEGIKLKEKTKEKMVDDRIKAEYNIPKLLKVISEVRDEYLKLERDKKSKFKNLTKLRLAYEQLETSLFEAAQSGEIKNVKVMLEKIPSETVRFGVLKFIYNHNKAIYDEMSSTYQTLSANDSSHYQVLLAKHGISPGTYEIGTVMKNSIQDLTMMLEQLSKLNFASPEEMLTIVQTSNLETVNSIQSLIERRVITTQLLSSYKSIFNPSSNEYENLMRNINEFQGRKINPHNLIETQEVFLTSHQKLSDSLDVLENYELLAQIKKGQDLSFLKQDGLSEAIDTLLELGYEKNLEENLEILNYKDRFDRLRILKALNIPVTDTASLIDVLSTDKFYVSDSESSKYIYNAVSHVLPKSITFEKEPKKKVSDVTKLSEFSYTQRTYSFDGVLISKNKVHRNLSHITSTGKQQDRLLYGIINGSSLTNEEVSKITTCISGQKNNKVVKEKK